MNANSDYQLNSNKIFNYKIDHTNRAWFQTFVGVRLSYPIYFLKFSKKKNPFLLEMVKNCICLGSASKENAFFFERVATKKRTHAPMSRIGFGQMKKGHSRKHITRQDIIKNISHILSSPYVVKSKSYLHCQTDLFSNN